MASSKDFEKIWKSYQDVAQPKGVSIVDHCQRNGIVYSQFQRWYVSVRTLGTAKFGWDKIFF